VLDGEAWRRRRRLVQPAFHLLARLQDARDDDDGAARRGGRGREEVILLLLASHQTTAYTLC
jgi:cytochrome P450